ncbi:MAG: MFS transporter [Oscillospiraceae bacterium]|nr:MFS transporter [Oscillospiraceae bacterium]
MKKSTWSKWIGFIILTLSAGIIYRAPYLKSVFYTPMQETFNLTNLEIAGLMSVYSLSKTILYIPGGILVDRFDNRKMLTFSLLGEAILTAVYATIPSLGVLRIIQFLYAVVNVIFWCAFVKAVRMFGSAKEQGSVFGYSEGIRAAASLIINFVALGIMARMQANMAAHPLSGVLWLYAVVYALMAIALWFVIPSGTGNEEGKHATFKDYLAVLKVPAVWLVSLLVCFAYSVQVASEFTTGYLNNVMGMTAVMAGVVATIRSYGIGLFAAPIVGKITDHASSYSRSCIVLLLIEIVLTIVLLIIPGQPSYVVLCIIVVLAFAAAMYSLRGVYYATMGEAGVPVAMTATATGIISVIGYLPDTFMNLLIGDKLDKYPGAAGYKYIFVYMIVFAALAIAVAFLINRIAKKNAEKAEAGSNA